MTFDPGNYDTIN